MSEMSNIQTCKDDYHPAKKFKVTDDGVKLEEHVEGLSLVVATHYNKLEEKGLMERNKSRIVYLRNFNNWIKSMLIGHYVSECREEPFRGKINVLDMCCGKGGDLLKWQKGDISHLICADIAEVSIEQCQCRYNTLAGRSRDTFTAEFIVADCTKVRLKDKFQRKEDVLDIVSCQFSFHYSFESVNQADCMMRNASECLRTGGYFIGTIPNSNDIVARQRKSNKSSFGNDVYKIEFQCDTTKQFPLFGAKYDFYLEGVVNCPEFLVHFPTLVELGKKHGLKLVLKERFSDYFNIQKENGRQLLGIMKALETYPPFNRESLQGDKNDYTHAEKYLQNSERCKNVGTLSSSEWDIASLYLVFAFQKI